MVNDSEPEGTILETLFNSIMKILFLTLLSIFGIAACNQSVNRSSTINRTEQTPQPMPAQKSLPKIVAFGDSLTAGYGLSETENYPALLQNRLRDEGYEYTVVNAGVSGDTSAGGLRRIDWVLDEDVKILILELGANDMLRGQPIKEMRKNLAQIIERAQAKQIKVLLAGMYAPTSAGLDYQKEIHEAFRSLAEEYKIPLIPFFLDRVGGVEELNQSDGIHPNAEGTKIVAETVYTHLKPLLEK
jgi:acyl-CoA thioesterase I